MMQLLGPYFAWSGLSHNLLYGLRLKSFLTLPTLSLRALTELPPLGLEGPHQLQNASTALCAAAALKQWSAFDRLSLDAIGRGFRLAWLPGRFQRCRLGDGPLVILDGAHTPEAARFLVETLRSAVPAGSPVALVLAMAADKDIGCGLGVLHLVLNRTLKFLRGSSVAGQSFTHRGVCAELGKLQPVAIFPVEVDVAGARARSAAPGTIMANWQFNGRPDAQPSR